MKTWDTHHLSAKHRFGYWRDVLCEAFTALDSTPEDRRDQGSTVTLHELAGVNAAELSSFPQLVTRGREQIRRRADEFYFANLQVAGDCEVEQDGRRISVKPGSFYLVDTTRPYSLRFVEAFRTVSFRIPHHQLTPLLADPRKATARLVNSSDPLGQLATAHMAGVLQCAPTASPAVAATLADTLASLISVSVLGAAQAKDDARQEARRAFRASIVHHVNANSADPDLSVGSVAARFRVSPRYVHDVFGAQSSSFAQTVLENRLETAARLLADPMIRVTEAALRSGFGDLSYFGRVFHRRYGVAPREWQRQASGRSTSPSADG
jgi:AraC family transcriptional activator of tynA and feaB